MSVERQGFYQAPLSWKDLNPKSCVQYWELLWIRCSVVSACPWVAFPWVPWSLNPPHEQFRTQPRIWGVCSQILDSLLWGSLFSGISSLNFHLLQQPGAPTAFSLMGDCPSGRVVETWILPRLLLILLGSNPIQFLPAFDHSPVPSCLSFFVVVVVKYIVHGFIVLTGRLVPYKPLCHYQKPEVLNE